MCINMYMTVPRRYFFCGSFLFCVCLCHFVLSVSCSLVVTCWEMADFLALLYVRFSCVFVTFQYGILGQVWYLVVSIPDLCVLPYLTCQCFFCIFRLSNLEGLEKVGLYINDLNMFDNSRDMVMAGWQYASQLECSIEQVGAP